MQRSLKSSCNGSSGFKEIELAKVAFRAPWKIWFPKLDLECHSGYIEWLCTDRIQDPLIQQRGTFCLLSFIARNCCYAVVTEKTQFKIRDEVGGWKKGNLWTSVLPGPIIHPLFYRTCHTVMRIVCPVSNQWSKHFVLCFSNHRERLTCTACNHTSVQLYSQGTDSWLHLIYRQYWQGAPPSNLGPAGMV